MAPPTGSQSSYEQKITQALQDVSETFEIFLSTLMASAQFENNERCCHHSTYQLFKNLCLIQTAQSLQLLKSNISESLDEYEISYVEKMQSMDVPIVDFRIKNGLALFSTNFPLLIKTSMLKATFHVAEASETHICFITLFSIASRSLADLFFSRKAKHGKQIDANNEDWNRPGTLITLISESRKFLIFCADTGTRKYVLKTVKSSACSQKDIERLHNELEVAKTTVHPSYRSAFQTTRFQNRDAVVLEWAPGESINNVKSFSVSEFLNLAREIASALQSMHQSGRMHLNLSCEHIIYDNETKSTKIIGCGSSKKFHNKLDYMSNEELSEKSLFCISPEQTNRTGKEIDFRSDLYSLGVIFYRILTGLYPFIADDAFDLVHMHILHEPVPVADLNTNVPELLSTMIMKLLKKNADERYQSVKGIIYDLDLFMSELPNNPSLTGIKLALHDKADTLLIPQKLYRDSQFKQLCSVFDKLSITSFELVFLSGSAGSGTSNHLSEFYQPVLQRNGVFLRGKFDKSKDEPYSALLEAIRGFCDDLLLRNEESRNKYIVKIKEAIADEGRILTDLVCNLQNIIGEQPNISSLYGKEAKNRLNYVILKFLKAISSLGSPVVLVLEDLQWCDVQSINFLTTLLRDKSIQYFMLVGTFREDEVCPNYSLKKLFEFSFKNKMNQTYIKLENHDLETVNTIISDALRVSPVESYSLTAVVYEKTSGNHFYVNHMLKSLFEQGLLYYSTDTSSWRWDGCENETTESAIQLLCKKIGGYDENVQQALKIASCLGSPFDLSALKVIVNCSKTIEDMFSTGLVVSSKGSNSMYRFTHDIIEQAANSLLPKDRRKILFYIANKLWRLLSKDDLDKNMFVVANLFYGTVDLLEIESKRLKIAEFLYEVGEKAMKATAFQQAFRFFNKGIELLNAQSWKTHYDLSLKLFESASKAGYSIGNYRVVNNHIDTIFRNVSSPLQLASSYSLKMRFNNDLRLFEVAIQDGIYILQKIDRRINLNEKDEKKINEEIQRVKNLLAEVSDAKILELPEMVDETALSIMMISNELLYSTLFFNPQLLPLITTMVIQISFQYGISKYAAYGFCSFGLLLRSNGDSDGYRAGKIALRLLRRSKAKELYPKVYNCFYHQISPFFEPIVKMFDPMLRSYKIGLEVGGKDDCSYSAHVYCAFSFLSGRSLHELADEIVNFKKMLEPHAIIPAFLAIEQATFNLIGENDKDSSLLQGDAFDYNILYQSKTRQCERARPLIFCGIISLLFHNIKSASKFFRECRSLENYFLTTTLYPFFLFYEGLTALDIARLTNEKENHLQCAKQNISKLKEFASNAPGNFLNKAHILEAELSTFSSDKTTIVNLFSDAISLSEKNGFPHESAIACERLGVYLLNKGCDSSSKFLLQAFRYYKQWGAIAKQKHLTVMFPEYFTKARLDVFDSDVGLQDLRVESKSMGSISQVTTGEITGFTGNYTISSESKRRRTASD